MRAALYLGTLLVFLAGVQLFVLTRSTEHVFAWTVAAANSAAFLGAFYWTSVPLAFLSARQRTWDRARVGVPGVLIFLWMTLATTLIHLGKFHFHSPHFLARAAAWTWLLIYAIDPVLLTAALIRQTRAPGVDAPRSAALNARFRGAVALNAVVVIGAGIALFAVPTWAATWWPWTLTALTARAMASWLLGMGVVLVTAVIENDWRRIRSAIIAYALLGLLELVALARFRGDIDWNRPAAWLFVAFFAGTLIIGADGWREANRARLAPP